MWFNDVIARDDCVWGFNKKGMLKRVKAEQHWTYFLGSIDKEQYYFRYKSRARRRTHFFKSL